VTLSFKFGCKNYFLIFSAINVSHLFTFFFFERKNLFTFFFSVLHFLSTLVAKIISWYFLQLMLATYFLQAVCDHYNCPVDNFHSLVDGKAIWCLLDYYFQKELHNVCSLKVLKFFRSLLIADNYFLFVSFNSQFFYRNFMKKVARHRLCQWMSIQMHCTISYCPRNWPRYWGIFLR